MIMPTILLKTTISAPIHLVFDLARSVSLHLESTAGTGEHVVAGRKEGLFELGDEVTWRAKHFGIWQNLSVRITEMDPPRMFADEMVKGAFHSFRYEHWFEESGNETVMIDVFRYQSPLGPLGKLADWLLLKRYMQRFLAKRNAVIKEVAEKKTGEKVL